MRIRVPPISRSIVEWPRNVSDGQRARRRGVVMPSRTVPERGLVYDRSVPDLPFALDHVVALVPVRGLEGAKARLGEALDAEERRALVERLLARHRGRRRWRRRASSRSSSSRRIRRPSRVPSALGAHGIAAGRRRAERGARGGPGLGRGGRRRRGARRPGRPPGGDRAPSWRAIVDGARALAASRAPPATERRRSSRSSPTAPGRARTSSSWPRRGPIPFRFGEGSRAAHADAARRAGARLPRDRRPARARPRHARRPARGRGGRARRASGPSCRERHRAGPGAAADRPDEPARPAAGRAPRGPPRRRPRGARRRRRRGDARRPAAAPGRRRGGHPEGGLEGRGCARRPRGRSSRGPRPSPSPRAGSATRARSRWSCARRSASSGWRTG